MICDVRDYPHLQYLVTTFIALKFFHILSCYVCKHWSVLPGSHAVDQNSLLYDPEVMGEHDGNISVLFLLILAKMKNVKWVKYEQPTLP